jgi:hypothetical protein
MAIIPGKLGLQKLVTGTGSFGEFDIDTDGKIKFTTVNAGPNFTIEVKGRIAEQKEFTFIANVVGPIDQVVHVVQWDFLQINVTVYDSTSNHVKLDASGFNEGISGGVTSVNGRDGNVILTDADVGLSGIQTQVNTIDASVATHDNNITALIALTDVPANSSDLGTFTGNIIPPHYRIKQAFQVLSDAIEVTPPKYTTGISLIDWIGPSADKYTLTINYALHKILNPTVSCYEDDAGSLNLILVPVNVDASNNILITIPATPDSRFTGKIVIE